MTISQTQGQALAAFVARVRDDWDQPGILAAISKAQSFGSPTQIGRALLALAENRELRTPALLASPGKHWVQDGEPVGPNVSHNVRCPEHPINFHPCPLCEAKRQPPPTDDPEYVAMKKALEARRQGDALHARATTTDAKKPKLTDAESAAIARARIDQETNR